MVTSGSYSWNPSLDDIITDAYERCGIEPSDISSQMWTSALYSMNGVMAELSNMQLNLWEVAPSILTLTEGVNSYLLEDATIDVLEAYRRSYTRVLGGTAASSAGGTAGNAFDGDLTTSCVQVTPDGNISYDYGSGNPQVIVMCGYMSAVNAALTLVYEGSLDGSTWYTLLSNNEQNYTALQTIWKIIPATGSYRYYRVRETGGATLNATEVYFANDVKDYPLGRLSREDYDGIAFKNETGIPVAFYIERTINPYIHIYLNPNTEFTMVKLNRIRQLQTVSSATQTVDAPFRFIESVTAMLAVKLAVKRAPDRLMMLKTEADKSAQLADTEDRERVAGMFVPDMSGYRIS